MAVTVVEDGIARVVVETGVRAGTEARAGTRRVRAEAGAEASEAQWVCFLFCLCVCVCLLSLLGMQKMTFSAQTALASHSFAD